MSGQFEQISNVQIIEVLAHFYMIVNLEFIEFKTIIIFSLLFKLV